jgi:hypothetical protein
MVPAWQDLAVALSARVAIAPVDSVIEVIDVLSRLTATTKHRQEGDCTREDRDRKDCQSTSRWRSADDEVGMRQEASEQRAAVDLTEGLVALMSYTYPRIGYNRVARSRNNLRAIVCQEAALHSIACS